MIPSVFTVSQQCGLLPQDFCSEKARTHCPREMIGKRKEQNSTGFSKIQWFLIFHMNQNYLVGSLKQFAVSLPEVSIQFIGKGCTIGICNNFPGTAANAAFLELCFQAHCFNCPFILTLVALCHSL